MKASTSSGNKIRLLRIWDILKKETDIEYPMSTATLISRLNSEGLKCDRRTLYNDIALLNSHGYEVMCNRSSMNEYYVVDREFDAPEIQILIDAVQAASFITKDRTLRFIDKLGNLAGNERAKVYKQNLVRFNTVKGTNEKVLYSVNEVSHAILNKNKITFYYYDIGINGKKEYRMNKENPEQKKLYKVSPLATIFSEDKYYLIAFDDHYKKLTNYRIDHMDNVNNLEENITSEALNFDLKEYETSIFKMYSGKRVMLVLEAERSTLNSIFDKFGNTAIMNEIDEDKVLVRVNVQISNPLLTWLIGFGNKVRVRSPKCVIEDIKNLVETVKDMYL